MARRVLLRVKPAKAMLVGPALVNVRPLWDRLSWVIPTALTEPEEVLAATSTYGMILVFLSITDSFP